ncbi:MAG TPA: Maf family protein, partial [Thermoanaerobaculaceae bacterium]|nr:Maf family protein [Thermoanaerobaculaceae bacterium]
IVDAPNVDESPLAGEPPAIHAARIAGAKVAAVAPRHPELPVLGADTVVAVGERILGKPPDRDAARAMLTELSGRTHVVVTALALRLGSVLARHLDQARVTFVPFDRELIRWYLATGEGDDKAGAYAVQGQGAVLVAAVEGNVQTVVGLPLAPLPALFARVGLSLHGDGDRLRLDRRE